MDPGQLATLHQLPACPVLSRSCLRRWRCQVNVGHRLGRRQIRAQAKEAQEAEPAKKGKRTGKGTGSKGRGRAVFRNARPLTLEERKLRRAGMEGREVPPVDTAFEDRVRALKSQTLEKQPPPEEPKRTPLDTNIYDNPPPLLQTLFGQRPAANSSPEQTDDSPKNKPALLAGTLLLVLVFLLTSGAVNFGPSGKGQQAPELSEEQKAQLQQQIDGFEAQLATAPDNVEALEGAGVTYAQMGALKKAQGLLVRLVEKKAQDPEAWQLLAETRAELEDYQAAAAAYEKALQLAPSIDLLQGLAGSYVTASQQEKAVEAVQAMQQRVSGDAEQAVKYKDTGLGPVELKLLLGKIYSQWRGHDSQALAAYEAIIKEDPDDFRGYLAKGVLLREEGQRGDAQRMFLQARYIAPPSARAVIDRVIGRDSIS